MMKGFLSDLNENFVTVESRGLSSLFRKITERETMASLSVSTSLQTLGSKNMENFERSISGRGDFLCHEVGKGKGPRMQGIIGRLGRVGWQG